MATKQAHATIGHSASLRDAQISAVNQLEFGRPVRKPPFEIATTNKKPAYAEPS
jgi:hypothetical protein